MGYHGCVYNKFGNSVLSALQNVFKCKSLNIKREDLIQTTGLHINKRITPLVQLFQYYYSLVSYVVPCRFRELPAYQSENK